MHRLLRSLLAASIALISLALTAYAQGPEDGGPDPFGFTEGEYSTWGITEAAYPFTGRAGCFPVGNGVVFGVLGVDPDFNQLGSLTGPGYQTRDEQGGAVYWQEGNWPEMPLTLVRVHGTGLDGQPYTFEPVRWETQSIQQLRGAAMVRTVHRSGQLTLYCMTYAVPETCILERRFMLAGAEPGAAYGLSIDRSRSVYDAQDEQQQGDNRLVVFCQNKRLVDDRHGLTVFQHDAAAWQGTMVQAFDISFHVFKAQEMYVSDEEGGLGLSDPFLEHFSYYTEEDLSPQRCYTYWREWSSHNLRCNTGDARLDDLMAQLPVIIETQRDAASGGYSPMVNYHGCWVRDSLGPLYVNLLNQRFDAARQMLAYHRKACWKLQNCSMLVPLDIDVSDVGEPRSTAVPGRDSSTSPATNATGRDATNATGGDASNATGRDVSNATGRDARAPKETDTWGSVPVEHAEVPSLIVLQHYWVWKCMRAAGQEQEADAFIAEAWPFITHNLLAMQFDPLYGVRFHGDETYTNGALYSTFDSGLPGQVGYPNGYIPTEFFSFDNTLLHWSAAMAVREIADSINSPIRDDAQKLAYDLQRCLYAYRQKDFGLGQGCFPAVSPVTQQVWPQHFSNMSLAGHSLGLNNGGLSQSPHLDQNDRFFLSQLIGDQYSDAKSALYQPAGWQAAGRPLVSWWTTPESGCGTGHALGTWLNAARYNNDGPACTEIVSQLLTTAAPEGAWCEVYGPPGEPVSVYGRINRIRPWESGINYAMLAAWFSQQDQLSTAEAGGTAKLVLSQLTDGYVRDQRYWDRVEGMSDHPRWSPSWFGFYSEPEDRPTWAALPAGTQLLVLTRDNRYQEMVKLDQRLAGLKPEQVSAWDIGLPITPTGLREALFPDPSLVCQPKLDIYDVPPQQACVPYLYLDRDVKLSDRRTFKTQAFWDELKPVLAEYQAAGGTVLDETSLEPSLGEGEAVGLKLLIVLYPHTFCWDMDAQAVADFHKEIAKWIRWYDQAAGGKLRLELDFLQIDRRLPPRACGPQGGNVYWMGYDGVEADLKARGIQAGQYDSVCCFWAWDREAKSLPDGSPALQAYGGAAQGPGSDMAFMGEAGRTSYYGAAVLKSHFVTTGRVALHEYLHNIDAMFYEAGMDSEFFSSDDMEQYMPQLLKERPGVFAPYGYDDAAMLDLAEKSRTGEAGFPWRTQLEYYKWCLERTPRSDYAKLLKRFGARVPDTPRGVLYDNFIMPEGEAPYQITFNDGSTAVSGRDSSTGPATNATGGDAANATGGDAANATGGDAANATGRDARAPNLEPITIEDVDKDGYVHWRSEAWGGVLRAPWPQPLRSYREAQLSAPDVQQVKLGLEPAQLRVELKDSVSGAALAGAQVKVKLAGQEYALADAGGGVYTAPLPAGLEQQVDAEYSASLAGYVISPQLCALDIEPLWSAGVTFNAAGPPEFKEPQPSIDVALDGPPGAYECTLEFNPQLNTVQQRLADDGLLQPARRFESQFNGGPGTVLQLGVDREWWSALRYCPGTLRTEFTAECIGIPQTPTVSSTQRIPPALPVAEQYRSIPADRLPPYIPHVRRLTPALDGRLDEWGAQPSLALDRESGHAFGPGFAAAPDGEVQLWLAYDDANLYMAGHVSDDMVKPGDMWSSDRLNFVFDALLDTTRETYPQGAPGHTGWTKDDYWLLLCPFVRGAEGAPAPLTERLGGEGPGGKPGYFGEVPGAAAQVVEDGGGYSFEWAVPLASLPYLQPRPGSFCGCTFFVSDHDAGLTELMYLADWWTPSGIEWRYWDCGLWYFE